jgi:hypothetical protein
MYRLLGPLKGKYKNRYAIMVIIRTRCFLRFMMHYNEETFDRITIVCTFWFEVTCVLFKLTLFRFLLVYHIYSIL